MKQLLLIAALFVTLGAMAQAPVKFTNTEHSFGKIAQNKPASYEFAFVNTGAKPLVIDVATAECGCTTPEYPKDAFPTGKGGKIKVTYNAANPGAFTKKVTVKFANVTDPVILTIQGEVIPAAPAKSK